MNSIVAAVGFFYSIVITYFIHAKAWSSAALMFTYGLAMLAARISRLLEQKIAQPSAKSDADARLGSEPDGRQGSCLH